MRLSACLPFVLLLVAPLSALAQSSPPTLSAAEKAEKQAANEEAEQLCKSIKDPGKFNQCLDLYFLDANKFKAFLDENGASKPEKPAK